MTTPASSRSRSRSRSHSRQFVDPHLIRENLRIQKDVIASLRTEDIHIRKKLKTVRSATINNTYIGNYLICLSWFVVSKDFIDYS